MDRLTVVLRGLLVVYLDSDLEGLVGTVTWASGLAWVLYGTACAVTGNLVTGWRYWVLTVSVALLVFVERRDAKKAQ